jgi:hypothetical protein
VPWSARRARIAESRRPSLPVVRHLAGLPCPGFLGVTDPDNTNEGSGTQCSWKPESPGRTNGESPSPGRGGLQARDGHRAESDPSQRVLLIRVRPTLLNDSALALFDAKEVACGVAHSGVADAPGLADGLL